MTAAQIAAVVREAIACWGCRFADPDFPVNPAPTADEWHVTIRGHGLYSRMVFTPYSVRGPGAIPHVFDTAWETAKAMPRPR